MIASEDEAKAWLKRLPCYDRPAHERLELLVGLLGEENTRQNLVSQASLDEVWKRHIVDSAQLLMHVSRETSAWLDLGTGAGFPGLVIAALRPDINVTMVESRARRIAWLEHACDKLDLPLARVEGCRLENLDSFRADIISARAFAPLPKLLELSQRFSTSDTIWLLPKGRSAQQELDELTGWTHMFHVEQSATDADSGIIVGSLAGRKGHRK